MGGTVRSADLYEAPIVEILAGAASSSNAMRPSGARIASNLDDAETSPTTGSNERRGGRS